MELPAIFICENNGYGMSMSSSLSMAVPRVSDRAAAYGMPGVTVDGNDVQAVFDAVTEAVARARAGSGPTLIEAVTYRHKGHSKSDQNLYRTREEIDAWRAKDPIGRFETALLESKTLAQEDIDAVRAEVRRRDASRHQGRQRGRPIPRRRADVRRVRTSAGVSMTASTTVEQRRRTRRRQPPRCPTRTPSAKR